MGTLVYGLMCLCVGQLDIVDAWSRKYRKTSFISPVDKGLEAHLLITLLVGKAEQVASALSLTVESFGI